MNEYNIINTIAVSIFTVWFLYLIIRRYKTLEDQPFITTDKHGIKHNRNKKGRFTSKPEKKEKVKEKAGGYVPRNKNLFKKEKVKGRVVYFYDN